MSAHFSSMFTLKTLLGRVYVQLLTYEDVSVCITLTLSPRLLTNVLLKTRSHTRAHIFVTKTYLYPFFVIWDSCLYHVLSHYCYWRECLYTTFDIQGSVLNILSRPICLHASSSTQSSVYAYVFLRERVPLAATNGLWHIFNVNDMSLHTKRWELGLGLDL